MYGMKQAAGLEAGVIVKGLASHVMSVNLVL